MVLSHPCSGGIFETLSCLFSVPESDSCCAEVVVFSEEAAVAVQAILGQATRGST